jgi:RNA polymerase sigma factor (sigma-70 family)
METLETNDATLVAESLTGNREVFARIVARYQTLICSLAYSGTGDLSQSEDLAQETFVVAWKQLGSLREPQKLRSWLCGIARQLICDALRKQGRDPGHAAESLEEISQTHSPDPSPTEQAISHEELAILWRALERIPEIYREPLVLFYREQQSIEAVARNLDLSQDAVKQRLSRGRKLLHERVLAFVEGALERTNPGQPFTQAVLASLPGLSISAKTATAAAAAKGGAGAKAAGFIGVFAAMTGPLAVFLPNYIAYRIGLAGARSEEESRSIKAFFGKVAGVTLGLFIPFAAVVLWLSRNQSDRSYVSGVLASGLTLIFLPAFAAFMPSARKMREHSAKVLERDHAGVFPPPAWEYRSKAGLFGLPLVHVRVGDRFACLQRPVKAWVAMGHHAVGGLFAFGATAVAPLSVGGMAAGLISVGGLSIGVFSIGAIALGVWAGFGAVVAGWQAFDGCIAIAWNAAVGNLAWAHDFALGPFARAAQANNDIARQVITPNSFYRCIQFININNHWLWLNLLWLVPMLVQWRILARRKAGQKKVNRS